MKKLTSGSVSVKSKTMRRSTARVFENEDIPDSDKKQEKSQFAKFELKSGDLEIVPASVRSSSGSSSSSVDKSAHSASSSSMKLSKKNTPALENQTPIDVVFADNQSEMEDEGGKNKASIEIIGATDYIEER
jgi:hypothetical protein